MTPAQHATEAQQQLTTEAAMTGNVAWPDHELVLARARVHAILAGVTTPGTHYGAAEQALEDLDALPGNTTWTERRRRLSVAEAHAELAKSTEV